MMRGMFAAISGLQVHQTMLDVDRQRHRQRQHRRLQGRATHLQGRALADVSAAPAPPARSLGGTNAAQIGLGVQLGSIDNQMDAGAIQPTGNPLDLAIQGDGFFRVADDPTAIAGPATPPTRAPATSRSTPNGNLVTQDG